MIITFLATEREFQSMKGQRRSEGNDMKDWGRSPGCPWRAVTFLVLISRIFWSLKAGETGLTSETPMHDQYLLVFTGNVPTIKSGLFFLFKGNAVLLCSLADLTSNRAFTFSTHNKRQSLFSRFMGSCLPKQKICETWKACFDTRCEVTFLTQLL